MTPWQRVFESLQRNAQTLGWKLTSFLIFATFSTTNLEKETWTPQDFLHTLLPRPFSCQETYQCLDVLSRLLRLLASHWEPHHWTNPADCPWHPWHQSLQCTHMPSSVQKTGDLKDVHKPPGCQIPGFQQSQPPFFSFKAKNSPRKKRPKGAFNPMMGNRIPWFKWWTIVIRWFLTLQPRSKKGLIHQGASAPSTRHLPWQT